MEYICIYQAEHNRFPISWVVIFGGLAAVVLVFAVINWKHNEIGGKIGMCLVSFVLLLVMFSEIYGYFSTYTIWDHYVNGNCLVVEGVIEEYMVNRAEDAPLAPDRFFVNGIDFQVNRKPSIGYGYIYRQCDGGLLKNGLSCKIYYVPFKHDNVIMELHIADDKE